MLYTPQTLRFQYADGSWAELRPIGLSNREKLRNLLNDIYIYCGQIEDKQMTFADAYEQDAYFRFLCDDALIVARLEPRKMSLDAIYSMLLPHIKPNGMPSANGILVDLNFGNKLPAHSKNADGDDTTYLDLLAGLWSELEDLQATLKLAADDDIPAEALIELFDVKRRLMQTPEERIKEKAYAEAKA